MRPIGDNRFCYGKTDSPDFSYDTSAATLAAAASPVFAALSAKRCLLHPERRTAFWPTTGIRRRRSIDCSGCCGKGYRRWTGSPLSRQRVSLRGLRARQLQRQADRRGGQLSPEERRTAASLGAELGRQGHLPCGLDHTGHMLISADYGGGSAASFRSPMAS